MSAVKFISYVDVTNKLRRLQYKYSTEENPRVLKECWKYPEKHFSYWNGNNRSFTQDDISTVMCENGSATVMKSLHIFVDEGVPIQVSEVNIFAAGRWR